MRPGAREGSEDGPFTNAGSGPRPLLAALEKLREVSTHTATADPYITEIRTEVADEPVRTTTLTYARSIEAPSTHARPSAVGSSAGAPGISWATGLSAVIKLAIG